MIYEYALEPALLTSWASDDRDYAEFFREYGLGSPRIISSFPKRKKSMLRRYLLENGPTDAQSLAAQRYIEMVQSIVEVLILRDVQYDQASWVDDVVLENTRAPFDVILSLTEVQEQNSITPSSMYLQNSIWECCRQLSVTRTNEEFLSKISNMIRLSVKDIVIIDPFGYQDESIRLINDIASIVVQNRLSADLPVIKIIYKKNKRERSLSAASNVKGRIAELLTDEAKSLRFEIFAVRQIGDGDVFHNRCILTENAGVISGHGFTLTGNECHTDELTLMDEEIYQKKWGQFVDMNGFEVASEAVIEP